MIPTTRHLQYARGYIDLGMVDQFSQHEIDSLFIAIQPAHLQKANNKTLDPDNRDIVRADMLRNFMEDRSK